MKKGLAWLLALGALLGSSSHAQGGALDFPWGASKEELVARYGDRLHAPAEPYSFGGPYYGEFEIPDYEFEGLKFVASLRMSRETRTLGEVLLLHASPEKSSPSLLAEFERLDRSFTRLFGITNARFSSDDSTRIASVSRGAIWSGEPSIVLNYDYFGGVSNAIKIRVQQSRATRLGRCAPPGPVVIPA